MIKFKLFNNFNTKKKIALIVLLILPLLLIFSKNYINTKYAQGGLLEVVKLPSIKIHLINIAKVAIPLKNLILMRDGIQFQKVVEYFLCRIGRFRRILMLYLNQDLWSRK